MPLYLCVFFINFLLLTTIILGLTTNNVIAADDDDYEGKEFTWFADPEDHETDKAFDDSYIPWVPTKVEDYLDHLELYKWWYTDEDTLSYERFGEELISWYNPDIHKEDVIIEMTFNEEGILSSYKVMNEDEEVVLEFALEDVMAILIPIIVVVVVVIAGLLSTVFLLGDGHLFGQVVGSENLITKEEQFMDFTEVDAGSGFTV